MRKNFISSLILSHKTNPNIIFSHMINGYPGHFIELTGYAGYILKMTDKIKQLRIYYDKMPECAKFIDDTWFSWCFNKLNIPINRTIECNAWNNVLDIPNTDPHPPWFELGKDTKRQKLTTQFLEYVSKIN